MDTTLEESMLVIVHLVTICLYAFPEPEECFFPPPNQMYM